MKLAMHMALLAALALMAGACGGGGGGGGGDDDGGRAPILGESGGGGSAAGAGSSGGSGASAGDTTPVEEGNTGGAPAQNPTAPSDHSYLAAMLLSAPDARLEALMAYSRTDMSVGDTLSDLQAEMDRLLQSHSGYLGSRSLLLDSHQNVLQDLMVMTEGEGLAEQPMNRDILDFILAALELERRAVDAQVMLNTLMDAAARSALAGDQGLNQGAEEARAMIAALHTLVRDAVDAAIADRTLGAGRAGDLTHARPQRLPPGPQQVQAMNALHTGVFQNLLEARAIGEDAQAAALVRAFYDFSLAGLRDNPDAYGNLLPQFEAMRAVLDQVSDEAPEPRDDSRLEARESPDGIDGEVLVVVTPAQAVSWFLEPVGGIGAEHREEGLVLRIEDGGPARTVRVTAQPLDSVSPLELDVRVGIEAPEQTGRHVAGHVVRASNGDPIGNALVEIVQSGQGVVRFMETDGSGHFRFEDLPADQLEIVVHYLTMQMEELVVLESLETSGGQEASSDIQVRMID